MVSCAQPMAVVTRSGGADQVIQSQFLTKRDQLDMLQEIVSNFKEKYYTPAYQDANSKGVKELKLRMRRIVNATGETISMTDWTRALEERLSDADLDSIVLLPDTETTKMLDGEVEFRKERTGEVSADVLSWSYVVDGRLSLAKNPLEGGGVSKVYALTVFIRPLQNIEGQKNIVLSSSKSIVVNSVKY